MLRQYSRDVSPVKSVANARSRVVISEAVVSTSRPQEVRSRNLKAIPLLKNLGGTNRVDIYTDERVQGVRSKVA